MSINADRYGDLYSESGGSTGVGERPPTRSNGSSEGSHGSHAAARLLEMTGRETDQWRADARSEAAVIVTAARTESAELVRAAREEAERLVTAAREEAERTTSDARVEAYHVREETSAARRRHDEEIAHLRETATEHREQLRRHLTDMLDRVDSTPGGSGQQQRSTPARDR